MWQKIDLLPLMAWKGTHSWWIFWPPAHHPIQSTNPSGLCFSQGVSSNILASAIPQCHKSRNRGNVSLKAAHSGLFHSKALYLCWGCATADGRNASLLLYLNSQYIKTNVLVSCVQEFYHEKRLGLSVLKWENTNLNCVYEVLISLFIWVWTGPLWACSESVREKSLLLESR